MAPFLLAYEVTVWRVKHFFLPKQESLSRGVPSLPPPLPSPPSLSQTSFPNECWSFSLFFLLLCIFPSPVEKLLLSTRQAKKVQDVPEKLDSSSALWFFPYIFNIVLKMPKSLTVFFFLGHPVLCVPFLLSFSNCWQSKSSMASPSSSSSSSSPVAAAATPSCSWWDLLPEELVPPFFFSAITYVHKISEEVKRNVLHDNLTLFSKKKRCLYSILLFSLTELPTQPITHS